MAEKNKRKRKQNNTHISGAPRHPKFPQCRKQQLPVGVWASQQPRLQHWTARYSLSINELLGTEINFPG